MLTEFENKIAEFINANGLFKPVGKILIAVSGGADSMALMHVLHSLQTAEVLKADLMVAHINHQLRGNAADQDEAFVINAAGALGLPVITKSIAVLEFANEQKLSIETAARKVRISALIDMATENSCTFIATAHHLNDNAETIVHRLLRGTGLRGLAGIWPIKKFENITFVRPLLCVSRDEIISYLEKSKINWRHDHTNENQAFTRNFIRHSLLPKLQSDSHHSLVDLLNQLSINCRRYIVWLENHIDRLWPQLVLKRNNDCIEFNKELLAGVSPLFTHEIFRRALLSIGSGERDLTQEHYENISILAASEKAKCLTLPHGFNIRSGKKLVFEKTVFENQHVSELPWKIVTEIFDTKDCDFEKFKADKTQYIEWFDAEKISGKLIVRARMDGDIFGQSGFQLPKKSEKS